MRIRKYATHDERRPAKWLQAHGYKFSHHFWDDELGAKIALGEAFITLWERPHGAPRQAVLCPTTKGWTVYLITRKDKRDGRDADWVDHLYGMPARHGDGAQKQRTKRRAHRG